MIRDPNIIGDAIGLVDVADYHVFAHGIVHRAIAELYRNDKSVDIIILAEHLAGKKLGVEIGGLGYLQELSDAAPSAANYTRYAEIIRKYSIKRQLIRHARDTETLANDPATKAEDARQAAERSVRNIGGSALEAEFRVPVVASALELDEEPVTWLWQGFIAQKGITLFSAYWKTGKTTPLAHLIRNMYMGIALCDCAVKSAKILYITEESKTRWRKRIDSLGIRDNVRFICRPFTSKPSITQWQRFVDHVAKHAETMGADLVVFDSLSALWPVRDENNAGEVQAALMPLWKIAERSGLMVVHHLRKGDGQEGTGSRGSGALPSFVDTIMELRRENPSDRSSRRRTITAYGRDDETPPEIIIELSAETNEYRSLGSRAGAKTDGIKAMLLRILPKEQPGYTFEEIKKHWPGEEFPRPKAMRALLNEGAANGDWICDGIGKKGDPKRYHVPA